MLQSAASAPLLQLLISTTEPCPATRVANSSDGVNPNKYGKIETILYKELKYYISLMSFDEKVKSGANVSCLISRISHLLLESSEPFQSR